MRRRTDPRRCMITARSPRRSPHSPPEPRFRQGSSDAQGRDHPAGSCRARSCRDPARGGRDGSIPRPPRAQRLSFCRSRSCLVIRPGYGACGPGPDSGLTAQLHARLIDNAVSIGRGDLVPLCDAARDHQVTVVCGMTERDDDLSRGTIYNTAVVIGPDGILRNRHRKLMPTNPERMVWGFGDGSTLNVVDTPCGRIGDDDLLGELHAARALCALRAGRRSLYRADLRQRRRAGSERCSTSRAKAAAGSSAAERF